MRPIDEESLLALEGSRLADTFTVWAYKGGKLVLPEPLEVLNWTSSDEAGETVKIGHKMTLTVADPEGKLGAWKLDDPLGVAGTQLWLVYRVGGAGAVNFARLKVVGNEPDEMTESREVDEYGYDKPDSPLGPHKIIKYATKAVVRLEAVDITLDVGDDRFEAPESPGPGATIISEFRRLTEDHFPVVVDPGVVDRPVARTLVFDREKLEACQDLASRISARYRMGGDGECHIYPRNSDPVWTVEPNRSLVSVKRKQSITGLYNRWVVTGKDSGDGTPVKAAASIESGPLMYDGDHKRRPYFYNSEMIENYGQALAYAIELREQFLASLAVELTIQTVPWPQGQSGDRILIGCPVKEGHVAYFPAEVTRIGRRGSPTPSETTITASVSYADVVAALGRTEWAQHITGVMPELTWDRMPGNWGTLPPITWNNLP